MYSICIQKSIVSLFFLIRAFKLIISLQTNTLQSYSGLTPNQHRTKTVSVNGDDTAVIRTWYRQTNQNISRMISYKS